MYSLIFTSNGSKKDWPPQKIPRNDGYAYIINMHVCNTTNSLKYKMRRIRRRRIAPTKEKPKKIRAYGRTGSEFWPQNIAGSISEAAMGGTGAGDLIFHSLCSLHVVQWKEKRLWRGRPKFDRFYISLSSEAATGGGGARSAPVWRGNELKKMGARSARARTRGQNPLVLYV
jgi:hypothetical protein